MIDAGLVWDSKTALQRANAFAEHDIFWLEEAAPVPDDYEGYRKAGRVHAHSDCCGRGGEQQALVFWSLWIAGRIDVVQVDLTRCGGFTEAMRIASLAWDRGLPGSQNHGFTDVYQRDRPRCIG